MSDDNGSVPTAHFESLYARSEDPWKFETSDYEQRKYAMTLEALGDRHFRSAFELGCSIGVLTAKLAAHCDTILGGDCSSAAIALASRKQAHCGNATFREMRAPDGLPAQSFDLIVLSEVLYFLSQQDLASVARYCAQSLDPGGSVVLVNYLGPTDAALSGDAAADAFLLASQAWGAVIGRSRQTDFRLEVVQKRSGGRGETNDRK